MHDSFRLHYYRHSLSNYGDEINGWLWESLAPGLWRDDAETLFCGIGTLIDQTMPDARKWVIFSSGVGYGPLPDSSILSKTTIACVRGPLSAKIMNLGSDAYVTDGAALLSYLPQCQPAPESERHGIVFMPHHFGMDDVQLEEACAAAGIEYLSPRWESKATTERLRTARLVIADAMHAAIVADTLRVPWIPVQTSSEINTFKWLDWTMSLDMPYNAIRLPSSSAVELIRNATLPLRAGNFAVRDATPENALRHYENYQKVRQTPWWVPRRNIVVGLHKHIAKPALTSSVATPLRKFIDKRALDATTEALRKAAGATSYLSDDRVFESKRDELASRFKAVTGRIIQ